MPSIPSLIKKLKADYSTISILPGDDTQWSSETQTISYTSPINEADILHELGHALLDHTSYSRDIELLEMERAAWKVAQQNLGPRYDVPVTDSVVQAALDTYRDWLHARSTCPTCSAIGVETGQHSYRCLACHEEWRVNEARICGLKRYRIQQ